jgi:hypothetical protein
MIMQIFNLNIKLKELKMRNVRSPLTRFQRWAETEAETDKLETVTTALPYPRPTFHYLSTNASQRQIMIRNI